MAFNLVGDRTRGFDIEVTLFEVGVKRMFNHPNRA